MKNRIIKIVLLGLLVVVLGYLRDTLFVRIAWYEKVITTGAVPPEPHALFNFLAHLSLQQLVMSRYLFTGFFIVVFFVLCWVMIKWFFNQKSNFQLLYVIFIAVLCFALLLYGFGWVSGQQQAVYPLSRYMIGFLETPLIFILLIPVLWGIKKMPLVKER